MIKRFALLVGVSMLASACSSQDTDTADAASVVNRDSSMPDSTIEVASATAEAQDGAQKSVDTVNIALDEESASDLETGERIVNCRILSSGEEMLDSPCEFSPQSNGGFTLMSKTGEGAIYDNILSVSVSKIDITTAEVRGLTSDGINSRWGQATRSKEDQACWTGSDFSVCAY